MLLQPAWCWGVLAVGAGFYRNYREIQNVSKDSGTAAAVSAEAAEDTEEESREEVTMAYPTVTPLVQPSETPVSYTRGGRKPGIFSGFPGGGRSACKSGGK